MPPKKTAASTKKMPSTRPRGRPVNVKSKNVKAKVGNQIIELMSGEEENSKSEESVVSLEELPAAFVSKNYSGAMVTPKKEANTSKKRMIHQRSASVSDEEDIGRSSGRHDVKRSKTGRDLSDDSDGYVVAPPPKTQSSKRHTDDVFRLDNTPSKRPKSAVLDEEPEDIQGAPLEAPPFIKSKGKSPSKTSSVAMTKQKIQAEESDEEAVMSHYQVTSRPSPEVDESDIGNRDPKLIKTYINCVNIKAAAMISWSDSVGHGNPSYSNVLDSMAVLNERLLYSAVVFDRYGKWSNLSRDDPALISTGGFGRNYFHAVGGGDPTIFTSVIIVRSCFLEDTKVTPTLKPVKGIEGALLEGEWERFVGAIGMVIQEDRFKGQLFQDYVSFMTAMASNTPSSSRNLASKSGKSSPFTLRASPGKSKTALNFSDIVPIYDVRKSDIDFKTALKRLKRLPYFEGDVPQDSCVVVGYTINTFLRTNDPVKNCSFNVQWVMVLGVAND